MTTILIIILLITLINIVIFIYHLSVHVLPSLEGRVKVHFSLPLRPLFLSSTDDYELNCYAKYNTLNVIMISVRIISC